MLSSNGPTKQGARGMKRIILIKDKVTMASFCFAFVEFVDIESASAVLAASMSPQLHPNGFRISDKPVAASFAHPYSFQPVTDFLQRDEACLMGSQGLGGVDGNWVRYWDETSSVAVLEFKVEEPAKASASQEKKKEKKKVKETKSAPPVPSALPLSDKPVMLSLSKGPVKIGIGTHKFTLDEDVLSKHLNSDDLGPEPNKPKPVQRVAALPTSKKTANIINKWNQMQGELHGNAPSQDTPATVTAIPTSEPVIVPPQKSAEPSPAPEDEFEFSDTSALMCILCSRQFKSLDQLKRHNKESDLHKKNYKDSNLREVARQKLIARKAASSTSQTPKEKEEPKYRDRASERRTLFNQPDAPLPDKDASISSSTTTATKKRYAEGPARPPTPPPPPARPAEDENNVGNKLLKMMGWKEGTGLGTDGDGRVDPVETAIYAQGAGLGASKGKDISRLTEGYGYLQMAQEAARERYGD
ncbi:hypothetical protein EST38_g1651 [Candolleomyces aberdarensis]|uniref:G-patch domain-containing protein n=1 Tax=Candolleomyces aberdarensis TaxID=2316362 RepID=A0A4Q2DWI0_9AGAR|nr:hypothetical protein EST38_g1651 [Candolleomyces aberdarensis]